MDAQENFAERERERERERYERHGHGYQHDPKLLWSDDLPPDHTHLGTALSHWHQRSEGLAERKRPTKVWRWMCFFILWVGEMYL